MEDPSIELGSLTRSEIIAKLNLKNSPNTTDRLQTQLKKKIVEKHPIHAYLNNLKPEDVRSLYLKIATNPTIKMHARMKKFIADEFFRKWQFSFYNKSLLLIFNFK